MTSSIKIEKEEEMVTSTSKSFMLQCQLIGIVCLGFMIIYLRTTVLRQAVTIRELNELYYSERELEHDKQIAIPSLQQLKHSILYESQKLPKTLPTMRELGIKTNTDKVTTHGYDRFYPLFLEPLRDSSVKVLEIGYEMESYKMWAEYFSKGMVYHLSSNCSSSPYKHALICGDVRNTVELETLLTTKSLSTDLDVIIDNSQSQTKNTQNRPNTSQNTQIKSTMTVEQQIASFSLLFERGLKPGGVFIFEDVHTTNNNNNTTNTNTNNKQPLSLITQLTTLSDSINNDFSPSKKPFLSSFGIGVDMWVSSVFFGQNCVIVTKMTAEEKNEQNTRKMKSDKIHFNLRGRSLNGKKP